MLILTCQNKSVSKNVKRDELKALLYLSVVQVKKNVCKIYETLTDKLNQLTIVPNALYNLYRWTLQKKPYQ